MGFAMEHSKENCHCVFNQPGIFFCIASNCCQVLDSDSDFQKKSWKCQTLTKCLPKNCCLWEQLSWVESPTIKNRKNWGEKMKVSDITIVINIMNITTNINIGIIQLLKPHHYRHHHHHYHHQEEKKKIEFSLAKRRTLKKRKGEFTSARYVARKRLREMDWRCTRNRYIKNQPKRWTLKTTLQENKNPILFSADCRRKQQETR